MKNIKKSNKLFLKKSTIANFSLSSNSMIHEKGGFSFICLLTKPCVSQLGACHHELYSKKCEA